MNMLHANGTCGSTWRSQERLEEKKALMALRGALGSGLGARDAAALCVAGVFFPSVAADFALRLGPNIGISG